MWVDNISNLIELGFDCEVISLGPDEEDLREDLQFTNFKSL